MALIPDVRGRALRSPAGDEREPRGDYLQLLSEKTAIERMLAETPEEDVLDRASLRARLNVVEAALTASKPDEQEPRGCFRSR